VPAEARDVLAFRAYAPSIAAWAGYNRTLADGVDIRGCLAGSWIVQLFDEREGVLTRRFMSEFLISGASRTRACIQHHTEPR
jgi:hypothetical protein